MAFDLPAPGILAVGPSKHGEVVELRVLNEGDHALLFSMGPSIDSRSMISLACSYGFPVRPLANKA